MPRIRIYGEPAESEDEKKERQTFVVPVSRQERKGTQHIYSTKEAEEAGRFRSLLADPVVVRRLQQNFLSSVTHDPDEAARIIHLSQVSGYPAWLVKDDENTLKQAEAIAKARRQVLPNFEEIANKRPITSRFLSQPENMAIIHDDIDNLVSHENAFQALLSGWDVSRRQMEAANLAGKMRLGQELTPEEYQRWEELNQSLETERPRQGFASWTYSAGKFLPQMLFSTVEGVKMGATAGAAAGLAALVGGVTAPAALPSAATIFLAGSVAGGFKAAHDLEANMAFNDLIRMRDAQGNGLDPTRAALVSEAIGIINGALEMAEIGTLLKPFGKVATKIGTRMATESLESTAKKAFRESLAAPTVRWALFNFAKEYAAGIATEASQEVLQEIANIVGEEFLKRTSELGLPPATAEEIKNRLVQTAIETAKGMAILGLPGNVINAGTDLHMVREARFHQEFAQALNDSAAQSKLKTRAPRVYRRFIEELSNSTGVEAAYVSPEAWESVFGQEGISGQEAANRLGLGEEYEQAANSGTDFEIPLPVYQEKIAGTRAGMALVPDTKFTPEGMTAREAEAAEARLGEEQRAVYARAQELLKKETIKTEDEAYIHEKVKSELVAAGRPLDEADYAAAINAAYFTTIAERAGKSARELFNSIKFQVRQTTEQTTGEQYQGTSQIEAFNKWFKDSKVVDEQGAPLVVYHGTPTVFEAFSPQEGFRSGFMGSLQKVKSGAFFFTDDRELAARFGENRRIGVEPVNIMPVYLRMTNPLDLTRKTEKTVRILKEAGFDVTKVYGYMRDDLENPNILSNYAFKASDLWEVADRPEVVAKLKEMGYDGLILSESDAAKAFKTGRTQARSFAVFSPEQIKSIDNRGTWNPQTANIYEQSTLRDINSDEFRRWFGKSKVIDNEGNPLAVFHGTTRGGFAEFHTELEYDDEIEAYISNSGPDPTAMLGAHFAQEKTVAENFAKGHFVYRPPMADRIPQVYEVYLSLQNPLITTESELKNALFGQSVNSILIEDFFSGATDEDAERYDTDEGYRREINQQVLYENLDADDEGLLFDHAHKLADEYRQKLIGQGYDGIIYFNEVEGGTSYVAFYPEQIKSVDNRGTWNLKSANIYEQSAIEKLGFYSALEKSVAQMDFATMPAKDLAARLRKTQGLKQEELDYVGILDYLDTLPPDAKVTKDEIVKFVNNRGLSLLEIRKGAGAEDIELNERVKEAHAATEAARDKYYELKEEFVSRIMISAVPKITAETAYDYAALLAKPLEHVHTWDRKRYNEALKYAHDFLPDWDLRPLQAAYIEFNEKWEAENISRKLADKNAVKYEMYILPGGDRYREILLTLPERIPDGPAMEWSTSQEFVLVYTRENGIPMECPAWFTKDRSAHIFYNTDSGVYKLVDRFMPLSSLPLFYKSLEEAKQSYRERLLKAAHENGAVASEFGNYLSPHWDEINVLTHFRLDDRILDNHQALFIEEIQSDWHQKGRKAGYRDYNLIQALDKAQRDASDKHLSYLKLKAIHKETEEIAHGKMWELYDRFTKGEPVQAEYEESLRIWNQLHTKLKIMEAEAEKLEEAKEAAHNAYWEAVNKGVPPAPFKNTEAWVMLSLKRILRMAAEEGYQAIAWTSGQAQAERYDLRKYLDSLHWYKTDDRYTIKGVTTEGTITKLASEISEEELPDFVGKDMAQHIMNDVASGKNEAIYTDLDLAIGGEGMVAFYDQMLPRLVEKYFKKFDKEAPSPYSVKLEQEEEKIPQMPEEFPGDWATEEERSSFRRPPLTAWIVPLTEKIKQGILAGQTLFQADKEKPRAAIQFGDESVLIKLFRSADASSIMHESAHLWLNITEQLAMQENATEDIKNLWRDICDWLKVPEGQQLTREQHEQFANAFETYLAEGQAPSSGLARAFEAFRAWLLEIYRKVVGGREPISADVRAIFDRMLSSDDALADNQARQGLAEHIGKQIELSPEDMVALDEVQKEAEGIAKARMMRKIVGQLLRENKKKEKSERIRLTEELTREYQEKPIYKFLNSGTQIRLADVQDHYPEETTNILKDMLSDAPTAIPLADLAEEYGFSSGDEMIKTLMATQPLEDAVRQEVSARIEAARPTRADIERAALESIHNEKQLELLAMEEQILAQKVKAKDRMARARAQAQAIREIAKQQLAQKPWIEARRFDIYLVAERRNARAAIEALERGYSVGASNHKYLQTLNAALVRESLRLDKEIDRILNRFDKIAKRKPRQTLGLDREELAQLDQLLARFGIGEGLATGESAPTLAEWAKQMEDAGELVSIPEEILEGFSAPLRSLTTDQLLALDESVENILQLGRQKHRLISQAKQIVFEDAVNELVSQAYLLGRDTKEQYKPHLSVSEKLGDAWQAFNYQHTKVEYLMRWLDDRKDFGPWQRLIYQPIADANGIETVMRMDASQKLQWIMNRYYNRKERGNWHKQKVWIPEMDQSLTKEEILSLALNWGNEGNRNRIRAGQGWNDLQVKAVLDTLEKKDWDFVQEIWDYIDSYWPLCQQMVAKMGGVAPEKVEASPIETKFGIYRGGYYPIKYDSRWSEQALAHEEKESVESYAAKKYLMAATKRGHLKERVKTVTGRPVKLDLSVISEHLNNVIHDLAFRPAIRDVWRLINNKKVEKAIKDTFGHEAYRQLKPWLQDVASEYREPLSGWMKLMSRARKGAAIANMGWKFTVALSQVTGFFPMMRRVGAMRIIGATLKWYANPLDWKEKLDFIYERSPFMMYRASNFDRDVRDAVKKLVKDGTWDRVKESYFWFVGLMDKAVCWPGWMAAYEKTFAETQDEEKAIQAADALIRQTQGSGYIADLSAIQRGGETQKLFTMFYSYFNVVYNMMAEDIRATVSVKDIPKLAAMTIYVWVLPAIIGELASGRPPGEDDEEKKKWWLETVLGYPFSALVGIRDIARAILMNREYEMSPVQEAYDSVRRIVVAAGSLANDPADEETIKKVAKAAVEVSGYWAGIPSKQLIITLGNVLDFWTGKESDLSFRDLIYRKLPNER